MPLSRSRLLKNSFFLRSTTTLELTIDTYWYQIRGLTPFPPLPPPPNTHTHTQLTHEHNYPCWSIDTNTNIQILRTKKWLSHQHIFHRVKISICNRAERLTHTAYPWTQLPLLEHRHKHKHSNTKNKKVTVTSTHFPQGKNKHLQQSRKVKEMPASSWEDQTRSIKKSNSWNFRVLRNIQRRWPSTLSKGLTVQGRKVHSPTESVCYSMEDESSKWLTHEKKVPARELRTEY